MIFDILFLPVLFFIGLITAYEDIRYGKVRNKWILLGLIWGLSVIFCFFVWYFIASPLTLYYYFEIQHLPDNSSVPVFTVSLLYLGRVLLNAFLALLISFLMWRFNAWAAGDAKLFVVFALLLPLKYYWKSYLSYFPSFALLINIFIPIFLYLFFRSCFYYLNLIYFRIFRGQRIAFSKKEGNKKDKKKAVWEKIKNMAIMLSGFISIFLIFGFIQAPIKKYFSIDISTWQMFIFAGLIIFSGSLSKVFQKPITLKIIVILLIILLSYGFIFFPGATWEMLGQTIKNMAVFMVVLGLFRKVVNSYVLKTSLKEISIDDLEPKMTLSDEIMERIKKDKEYYNKNIGYVYSEGLTLEQVMAIKRWARAKRAAGMEKVRIYKPFPFVLWMLIGLVVTLVLKGSLFHLFLGQ